MPETADIRTYKDLLLSIPSTYRRDSKRDSIAIMRELEQNVEKDEGASYEENHNHLFESGAYADTISIKITRDSNIELPIELKNIAEEIKSSLYILKLRNNWDEEGSPKIKLDTFVQAVGFLSMYANWTLDTFSILIDAPKILPSLNGTIDLYWNKPKYDLLINMPAFPNHIAKFYGDDKSEVKVEGEFPLTLYKQGIFLCLLNLK